MMNLCKTLGECSDCGKSRHAYKTSRTQNRVDVLDGYDRHTVPYGMSSYQGSLRMRRSTATEQRRRRNGTESQRCACSQRADSNCSSFCTNSTVKSPYTQVQDCLGTTLLPSSSTAAEAKRDAPPTASVSKRFKCPDKPSSSFSNNFSR
ncbi:hypothetical protein F2P81_013199 [Scophthalmus maximus]|uniref:Uncharacterized protein n=1 Tax=Scophthalmus maximus TaxID=52904 RepID=A0A6A4SWR5_SCOMX|nr:hypothetical protein F2P81_013199 [Scophthalmus maximus]